MESWALFLVLVWHVLIGQEMEMIDRLEVPMFCDLVVADFPFLADDALVVVQVEVCFFVQNDEVSSLQWEEMVCECLVIPCEWVPDVKDSDIVR